MIISDEFLLQSYKMALELKLDDEFIEQLRKEISRRQLEIEPEEK